MKFPDLMVPRRKFRHRLALTTAIVATLGCESSVAPLPAGPAILVDSTAYHLEVVDGPNSVMYRLRLRATFVNRQATVVYVRGECDERPAPWFGLARPPADSTPLRLGEIICDLTGTAPPIPVGPGDSLSTPLTFQTALYKPVADSILRRLTGPMQLRVVVTRAPTPARSGPADWLPVERRTSPTFVVGLGDTP